MPNRHIHTQGFTLIELSIVLVIIGLVVGGILVGRDLIHGAAIRSQITQVDKLNQAVNTFKLKYNCVPGDCYNITTYLGTTGTNGDTIYNGNGDDMIDGGAIVASTERFNVFSQLGNAGLIDGGYTNVPDVANAFTRNFPASKVATDLVYVFNNGSGLPTNMWQITYFSPLDAYAIDLKMDDGRPGRGKVHGDDFVWASGTNDCLADLNYDENTQYVTTVNSNGLFTANSASCGMNFYWERSSDDSW